MTTHPLIFHNLLCEGPQTLIFVAAPPPEHPKSCNMYCYCRCRCLCFCDVVVELHTQCICVCVELKCYSGASRSNRGGNELGGWRGVFSNGRGGGLLCPCKYNFMCVCVCTPVNLYYTFIFMICIHLYLLFSSVCVCVYVCVCVCGMRESNRGQTVCGTSVYNLGGNSGSFWIMTTMPM